MTDLTKASTSRRAFLATSGTAVAGIAGSRVPAEGAEAAASSDPTKRMEMAEILALPKGRLWQLVKQCGVKHVVGSLGRRSSQELKNSDSLPWGYDNLARVKDAYEKEGFQFPVLEWRPPTTKIKLGLTGRDDEIEAVCQLLRNMGKLGVDVWCYEWMPVKNWMRTNLAHRSRGGALVPAFDLAQLKEGEISEYGKVTEARLWENLEYFLKRVVPVAEEAGVKLAMHPDDPPLSPILGMPRIMRSVDNYQRLIDTVPSPMNGITLCQGNFTMMTDNLPEVIRHFGNQKKIFFVHFRDVRGTPEKFEETFHDDGMTDMAACMRAYRDIEFDGVCRPDHVPTMAGDSNDRPGYSTIGRLFALGYIKGLQDEVYANA